MQLAMVGDVRAQDSAADIGTRYDLGRLAQALAARGHKTSLYTAADPRAHAPAIPGVTVVPLDLNLPFDGDETLIPEIGAVGRTLADDWTAQRPDVVYCHGWAFGLGAQLAARRHALPTVQALPSLRRRGAVGRLEALLIRSATRVTVGCDEDLETVLALDCDRNNAVVVPAGIDCGDIALADIAGTRGRTARRIVAVAQDFSPEQGLPQVVQAQSAVPGAELTLATPAGADDPRLAAALELAHRVDLGARVAVHRIVDRSDLCALLRRADVAVFPAHRDPVGSIVLHAMACGVAVIAAAAGAPRDIVVDDVTGMLVRPGDAGTLSRALRTVLAQPVLRHGMGLAARSRVRSRYGWDRIAVDAELVLAAAAGAATVAAASSAH